MRWENGWKPWHVSCSEQSLLHPMKYPSVAVLLFAALVSSLSHAATVTATYSATISSVDAALTAGPFAVGQTMTATLTWNDSVADSNASATAGYYASSVVNWSMTVGGYVLNGAGGDIQTSNDAFSGGFYTDGLTLGLRSLTTPSSAFAVNGFTGFNAFTITSYTTAAAAPTVFTSDAIPTGPVDLADFANSQMHLSLFNPSQGFSFANVVATNVMWVQPPTPGVPDGASTASLVAAACAGLATLARRRKV